MLKLITGLNLEFILTELGNSKNKLNKMLILIILGMANAYRTIPYKAAYEVSSLGYGRPSEQQSQCLRNHRNF